MSKPIIPIHTRAPFGVTSRSLSHTVELSICTKVQPSSVDQTGGPPQAVHTPTPGGHVEQTTITVQGTFSAFYPAERATVSVNVQHEASTRENAFSATLDAAEAVRVTIREVEVADSGVISRWSSNTVQVWSERPWTQDGQRGEQQFYAREDFSVTFADFTMLAAWVESVVAIDGVTVASIEWALTPGRKTSATTEVRARAVQDARTKATVYAQALGLGSVRAIAVADPGMLGDQVRGSTSEAPMFARVSSVGDAGESRLALTPEKIEVSATVDARFAATLVTE